MAELPDATPVTAEALRLSEERRRLAVAAAGLGDWYLNLATSAAELSRHCKLHLGLPPDATPSFAELIACVHPEDRVAVGLQLEQALERGVEFALTPRILKPDGEQRWLSVRGRALPGHPGEFVGVTLDVTETVWAERAHRLLAEAGRLLAAMGDVAATLAEVVRLPIPDLADYVVLYLLDEDGQIQRTALAHRDPAGEALLHELERSFPVDPGGPAPVPRVLRGELAVARATFTPDTLATLTTDAGERALLQAIGTDNVLAVPLVASGRRIGVLLFATTTSLHRYGPREEELLSSLAERAALAIANARLYAQARTNAQRAEEALARLNTLVDQAPIGVAFFDTELRFVRVNERLAAINGLPAAAHVGRSVAEVVPNLAEVAEPLLRRVLAENTPILDLELAGETTAAPGEQRIWRESYYPVCTADGRLLGVGALVDEITERVQAERERVRLFEAEQAARAAAEQAARQRDELLAYIAHDLKNPLTTILGATQMLQRRLGTPAGLDEERLRRGLGSLETASRSLNAQLTELQDIIRHHAGRPLDLERQPVDLVALARHVAALRQATSEQHQIEVEAIAPAVYCEGDPLRLERVLTNLLSNAVKYSPGGGAVSVRVAYEQDAAARWALVEVRDEGIGIPPEDLPHIFSRFYRGGNVARVSGSGLGLASVAAIVALHDGRVTAASTPGRGTTVTVRLPAASSEATASTHAER